MLKETRKSGDLAVIRPGLVLDAQASGLGHGLVAFNNELVSVYGSTLGFSPISEPPVVTDRSLPRAYDTVTVGGWDGSQFVGIGHSGNDHYSITSSDGITWAEHTIGTFVLVNDKTPLWNGAQWVWFPSTGGVIKAYTSSDGETWSVATTNLPYADTAFAFGNSVFCGVQFAGTSTYTSTDGVTWTENASVLPSGSGWSNITFTNDLFYMMELDGSFATPSDVFVSSANGVSWATGTLLSSSFWISIASSNGILFAMSTGVGYRGSPTASDIGATSTDDGVTWTQRTLPSADIWLAFGDSSGFYASASASPELAYSTNGVAWESVPWSAYVGSLASNPTIVVGAYTLLTGMLSIAPGGNGIPALATITGDYYDFAQGTI